MSKSNPNHKKFFATFFEGNKHDEGYAEREVNGWWLIRHWDGNANAYTIDVYSPESYRNYSAARADLKEREEQMNFLRNI
jgi:hypothetical protein